MAKSALPGVLLVLAGALVTYWSLTKLGLFVPKSTTDNGPGTPGSAKLGPPLPPNQATK